MSQLMIPYTAEGFELDWSKVIPINYDDVAMYINPRIAITFEKIWSPETSSQFSIGHILETNEDFDCDSFNRRLKEFAPFRDARVKRTFAGKRKSIFFDEEEIEILAAIFKKEKFTALINIYVDGEKRELKDLPKDIYKAIRPLLDYYKVIYPLGANEYKTYSNIQKAKIVKIKKKKEVNKMVKRTTVLKIIGGVILEGISIAGSLVGMKMINEGIDEIKGDTKDIILVEKDDER